MQKELYTGGRKDGIPSKTGAKPVHVRVSRRERERERRRKSKRAVLTGFLQISGSLTAMESNGAGRAESITGHNRFSHRSELGKAVLYCSTDSWHRVSTGKGAGPKKKNF